MRRLSLKRETLAALTADELSGVAAGASSPCVTEQATLCYLCAIQPTTNVLTITQRFTEQTCTW